MATLKASIRKEKGKGAARRLRAGGQLPAVAYGHGVKDRALSLDSHDLEKLLASINPENTIIELRVDGGRPVQALIREVQRHPSRPQILHVDLFQVRASEKLHVNVPVRFSGAPVGVRDEGGVLQEILRELSVECLPADIPTEVVVDIEGLRIGDAVHVKDVSVPKVTILNEPELVICSVTTPTVPGVEEGAEASAEPESAGAPAEEGETE
jgi:large subunit ribosomal protein L25